MLDKFKDLLGSLRDVTKSTIKENENSNTVQLLKTTINKIDVIIKTLDKMLKDRNIDIGDMAGKAKDKGKEYLEKGKQLGEEIKQKGFLTTAKEKSLDIKSKLTSMFKTSNETGTSPPEDKEAKNESTSNRTKEVDEEKKAVKEGSEKKEEQNGDSFFGKLLSSVSEKVNNIKEKVTEISKEQEKDNKEENEGSPKKQGFFSKLTDKYKERQDKRKKEIEEEKKSVQEGAKKPKGGGWLGKVLSGIMSLGGFLLTGFKKALGFTGGFLLKGFTNSLFSLVPSLSGGIARAVSGLVTGGLKGAASMVWGGVKAVAGSGMVKGAATALGRGALMIATGPVGWAVAIGTAVYAGYKLYKYLKRNDVADDIYGKLTRLRLLMYGFDDTNKEYYSKIFDLEMLLKDKVKFNNYKVSMEKLDTDTIEKIMDIFSVKREEKEKYTRLNTWYKKRFMPAYTAYMQALYSVNSFIYLDDLDKLKPTDVFNFITKLSIPSSIYDIAEVPTIQDSKTNVTKEIVDNLLVNITNEAKDKSNEKSSDVTKRIEEENKKKKEVLEKQKTPIKQETKSEHTPVPKQNNKSTDDIDTEGEPKPTIKQEKSLEAKVSNKLNQASGKIYPGGMSLEGITTKLDKEKIYNLDPNVRELFTGMAKEYNSLTNKSIPVNEAFRSFEDQKALYNKYPGKAAKPGNSTHEFGLAIDIASETANELDKLGLLRKYGFTRPIGKEKWHLEPIGVSLNPTLAKKDTNYRYKSILASPGKGGDGYGSLNNSINKKRDIKYQLAIYNKDGVNPIDPAKALSKNSNINLDTSKKEDVPVIQETSKSGLKLRPSISFPKEDVPVTQETSKFGLKLRPSISFPKENNSLDVKKPSVPMNENTDLDKYAKLGPEEAIRQAAKMVGMNEETMLAYAKMESSLKGNAKNSKSSATGLFQIVDDTWKELVKTKGPKYGIPADADRNNNFYNALMATEYAKQNLASVSNYKETGVDEATAVYLAHHYGPTGARKILDFLAKNPKTPMKEAVSKDAFNSNQEAIGNNTVESYVQKVGMKITNAINTTYPAQVTKSGTDSKSTTQSTTSTTKPVTQEVPKPPVYTATQSPYKTVPTEPTQPVNQQQPQSNIKLDTGNMETIMTNQLNTLVQIASLLTSIDGKIDLDKLKGLGSTQPPINKSIPNGAVNLSKKKIEA